jgi:hypothetical protein
MSRAIGQPVLARANLPSRILEPIRLGKGTDFDESWLQQLLFDHPEALPIADIEPGFAPVVAVAREVPCGHGFIDNLYLTGNGEIVLAEAKLWTNPQARREVVAQTLDYVAALSRIGYEDLEAAVLQSWTASPRPDTLYGFVSALPDALEERRFVDAVTANLRRGRILALAVGDGIRQEAEALGDLLQSHAGAHFTFALVEMMAYRAGDDGVLLVPRTLARTTMIERGVVRVENGRIAMDAVPGPAKAVTAAETISDKVFFEAMAARDPGLPAALRAFIASLEPFGVFTELKASLNLKWNSGDGKPVNLGYIQRNGQLWTNGVGWTTSHDAALQYATELARAIGGEPATNPLGLEPYVSTNGKSTPRIEQVLPERADGWRTAILHLLERVRADRQSAPG